MIINCLFRGSIKGNGFNASEIYQDKTKIIKPGEATDHEVGLPFKSPVFYWFFFLPSNATLLFFNNTAWICVFATHIIHNDIMMKLPCTEPCCASEPATDYGKPLECPSYDTVIKTPDVLAESEASPAAESGGFQDKKTSTVVIISGRG